MAVFQIGRLFADYDVDIKTASFTGPRLTVTGDVVLSGSSKVDQGKAIREQIIAMSNNPDEPFVAVQWSEDSTVNGFYRVGSVTCDASQMTLVEGYLSWAAELERVADSQAPPLESICSWQLVTNTRSVTYPGSFTLKAVRQFAVPGDTFEVGPASGTVSGALANITGPTSLATGFGTVLTFDSATLPANGIMAWSVDPTGYYDANCLVTTDFGTATDQMVFGRRVDSSSDWVVSNGMVRFHIVSGQLAVEHWDTNAWVRANNTNFIFQLAGTTVTYETMTILRNSPECVVVRLTHNMSNPSFKMVRFYVDLMILRGGSMVYGYISTPTQVTTAWPTLDKIKIQTTASVASTAVTGGFRATTADANGNQFVLVTGAPACTDTLASGQTVTTANSQTLSFGISSTVWAAADVAALEFFARRSEVTRVVAR